MVYSEKSIGVRIEGQEEARRTNKDVEDASGEREQERLFGEKGCRESSKTENGSWRDCCWGKAGHPHLRG